MPGVGSAWPCVEQGWLRAKPTFAGSTLLSQVGISHVGSSANVRYRACGGNLAPVSYITWLAQWG